MTATRKRKLPAPLPKPVQTLIAALRERDNDPAYAHSPVLDAYARISISIDGETEKVDRQLLDVLRAITSRGARLGEIHRDDNMSAWSRKGKRPGWRALMARFEAKAMDGVIAWHVDRMMRQSRDLEKLIDLADGGAIVATCYGEHHLDDSDDRFILRILVAAANKASDDASRRQKRKHEAMRDAGQSNGGNRAFGHQTPAGSKAKAITADQLQVERDAVAWSVSALLDGASKPAVADELNRRGVRTATGLTWYGQMIGDMVLKPRHAGLLPDGRPAHDVEAIITPADYHALAAMFAARSTGKRGRPEGPTGKYVLSGVLFCVCGSGMSAAARPEQRPDVDGQPYAVYRCPAYAGDHGNSIGGHSIVAWARAQMIAVLSDRDHARAVARRSAALERLDDQIATAKRDTASLAAKWGAGDMDPDEWEAARAALKARRARLDDDRTALLSSGAASLDTPSDAAQLAADWAHGTVDQRRRLLLSAMPFGIGVEPAGYSRPPADRLFIIDGR